jgi:APA family basic amino acid/polyamine antiporter
LQSATTQLLTRDIGLMGAVTMGLGAILGTGVFVSIGIAAGIAGPAVILATALAAALAICNGLSSAQLAASHSVSGGTYEYGYQYLNSSLGFTAGWMFLLAKSASAATAALGFAGYLLHTLGFSQQYRIPLAFAAVVLVTLTVLGGMRRTTMINILVVSVTLLALLMFVILGAPAISTENFTPFFSVGSDTTAGKLALLFEATALMFVAYTGYGRIATLSEEVHNPKTTIPKAIIITMVATMILYIAVVTVGIGVLGADALHSATVTQTAPLAVAAGQVDKFGLVELMAIGAITAMLGVLLNLVLGLSRVLLAMGRRRDMPTLFGRLNKNATTPSWATLGVGAIIAGLVLIGDIKTTWSFSAFTVLVYYAITNLAALKLPVEQRLYPRWIAVLGLLSCLFLAFWVEWQTWLTGLGMIVAGLAWHWVRKAWS